MARSIDCSLLATRTDFNSYARQLLNVTDHNLHLLDQCKVEVCGALWGEGNGDISGIGMIVGYILDHILGLALSALVLVFASRRPGRLVHVSLNCLEAFAYCATFFAFSIEVAAIVVLIREDFGINTKGMGDYTVLITQAVAMVILLPLAYPILTFLVRPIPLRTQPEASRDRERIDSEAIANAKASSQFSLLVVCWALAFYPFFSKMNAAFGPSKIAKHHGSGNSVITEAQFEIIEDICLGSINRITVAEKKWMTAFVILAYIPLSVFILGRILWLGVEKNHPGSSLHRKLISWTKAAPNIVVTSLPLILFSAIPLLACGLLWSIIRTQQAQEQLTTSYRGHDSDNYWTFGQIVAVTIFTPVIVECWSSWGPPALATDANIEGEPDRKLQSVIPKNSDIR